MTFEEAVKISIRSYYADQGFDSYQKSKGKEVKYNKKYFDEKEKLLLPEAEAEVEAEEVIDAE